MYSDEQLLQEIKLKVAGYPRATVQQVRQHGLMVWVVGVVGWLQVCADPATSVEYAGE